MLTAEGLKYAKSISKSYNQEEITIADHLAFEKHNIPYDVVSILIDRYIR